MEEIYKAVDRLKHLKLNAKKAPGVGEAIAHLSSTTTLLELSSPSENTFIRLCELLRGRLQPLYRIYPSATLEYVIAILEFVHNEKVVPALQGAKRFSTNPWESVITSIFSGILDYLEESANSTFLGSIFTLDPQLRILEKSREAVASVVYPVLGKLYFSESSGLLPHYDGFLVSLSYQVLVETLESPGVDVSKLRDKVIGSRRLGRTISETKDFLALESLLDILGKLVPPLKGGKEKRNKFLREVFDPILFKDASQPILPSMEPLNADWSVGASKIMSILAQSDINFPQSFDITSLKVGGASLPVSDPLFLDDKGFLANIDQNGRVATLRIPFSSIQVMTISPLDSKQTQVNLKANKQPLLDNKPMTMPQQDVYFISYGINKSKVDDFRRACQHRQLSVEIPARKKLSKAPSQLLPDMIKVNYEDVQRAKATKLTNMAKHGTSDPPDDDIERSSSPGMHHEESHVPFQDKSIPKVHRERSSEDLPEAVFIDSGGTLSVHPPAPRSGLAQPKDIIAVSDDNPLDTVSSDRPPAQQAPRNRVQDGEEDEEEDEDEDEDEYLPRPKLKTRRRNNVISDEEETSRRPTEKRMPRKKAHLQAPIVKTGEEIAAEDAKSKPLNSTSDPTSTKRPEKNKHDEPLAGRKRPVPDDAEAGPTPKRAHQDELLETSSSAARPKPPRYGGKKGRQPSISGPINFDVDFDELPRGRSEPPKPLTRAMKGKDGKRVAKPRNAPAKSTKIASSTKINHPSKSEALDKTLVDVVVVEKAEKGEGRRSVRESTTKASTKSKNTADKPLSKKESKAPWERDDFLERPSSDDVAAVAERVEEQSSDVAPSFGDDPSHTIVVDEGPSFEDKYVDFLEPVKGLTSSSSPRRASPLRPANQSSEVVMIDLTNSPIVTRPKSKYAATCETEEEDEVLAAPKPVQKRISTAKITKADVWTVKDKKEVENNPSLPPSKPSMEALVDPPPKKQHHISKSSQPQSNPGRFPTNPIGYDKVQSATSQKLERFPSPPPPDHNEEVMSTPSPPSSKAHSAQPARLPSPPAQTTRTERQEDIPKSSSSRRKGIPSSTRAPRAEGIRPRNHPAARTPDQSRHIEKHHVSRNDDRNEAISDPDEEILEVLTDIAEVVARRVSERFTGVSEELLSRQNALKQVAATKLREINYGSIRQYNKLFDLATEYSTESDRLAWALYDYEKAGNDVSKTFKENGKDFRRQSLCNKFPTTLFTNSKALAMLSNLGIKLDG